MERRVTVRPLFYTKHFYLELFLFANFNKNGHKMRKEFDGCAENTLVYKDFVTQEILRWLVKVERMQIRAEIFQLRFY